jgi:hypothetical protein
MNFFTNSDEKYIKEINFIKQQIKDNNYTVSNINSGIGDILLFKHYLLKENKVEHIYWNINHLIEYKPYPDCITNIIFNIKLLYMLYGKENISIFFNKKTIIQQQAPYFYRNVKIFSNLSNYILTDSNIKIYNFDYIVIHTKLRFRNQDNYLIKKIKNKLKILFSRIKTKLKIIILGEQKIASNRATEVIPSITTIYDECLELKKYNNVIDMTEKVLYNTPNMELFKRDINIIHNSLLNIGVGHGGQFCFNLSFSKKSLYYCPPGLIDFKIENDNFIIINDIESFTENIEKNIKELLTK